MYDAEMTNVVKPLLGPTRFSRQYPIKSIADTGARICFGSDWRVSDYQPLRGIQMAVTHQPNPNTPIFCPDERISLARAIEAYTRGSAYASWYDDESGTIEVGKCADVILLDKNLFTIDPLEIGQAKVLITMVDGEKIYVAKDFKN